MINPKFECHGKLFSELSQKAHPTYFNYCTALHMYKTTEFLQKIISKPFLYGKKLILIGPTM